MTKCLGSSSEINREVFRIRVFIACAALILACGNAHAKTIHVPADSATIQSGIDGALDCDTVLVADGTYTGEANRNIDFGGKRIVLKSENGPAATIIDCEYIARGFNFHSGEDSTSIIEGFTVFHGSDLWAGGGIYCESASPLVKNCHFVENFGGDISDRPGLGGGGLYCVSASPIFINCDFYKNSTGKRGGGICCDPGSFPRFEYCTIRENYTLQSLWYKTRGGGMHCESASPQLLHCTFYADSAARGGAISCSESSSPMLAYCIIAFSPEGSAVYCKDSTESTPTLLCCNLYGNGEGDWVGCIEDQAESSGNISANPRFCDPRNGDLSLAENSTCALLNNACGELIGTYDVGCEPIFNRTWYVKADGSGDAPTIQAAIDSCLYEDTVVVEDGIYTGEGNRDIAFGPKRITLRSSNGPGSTIIDCEGSSRGFDFFQTFQDSTARVEGFTIRNGIGSTAGGGIGCLDASPTIADCVIKNNTAGVQGGGVYLRKSKASLINCTIVDNSSERAGGIYCDNSTPRLTGCTISRNYGSWSGGIVVVYYSHLMITNSTLYSNSADSGGGVFLGPSCSIVLENSIIASSPIGESIFCYPGYVSVELSCCDIYGNAGGDWVDCIADQAGINGNMSLDPLFCDTANGDLSLVVESPCNPWNNECEVLIGALGMGCGCDCSGFCDLNLDGNINPVDVVIMVNFVYKSLDGREQVSSTCPSQENGDWNCDEGINPVDVVYYVNYVYKASGQGPCDLCAE